MANERTATPRGPRYESPPNRIAWIDGRGACASTIPGEGTCGIQTSTGFSLRIGDEIVEVPYCGLCLQRLIDWDAARKLRAATVTP